MEFRRRWFLLALATGLSAIAVAWLWPLSAEERLRRATLELLDSLTVREPVPSLLPFAARLRERFETSLASDLHVVVPQSGVSLPRTPRELALAAAPLLLAQGRFEVIASELEVTLQPTPTVRARIAVQSAGEGPLASGERQVVLRFVEQDGDYLLYEAIVEAHD